MRQAKPNKHSLKTPPPSFLNLYYPTHAHTDHACTLCQVFTGWFMWTFQLGTKTATGCSLAFTDILSAFQRTTAFTHNLNWDDMFESHFAVNIHKSIEKRGKKKPTNKKPTQEVNIFLLMQRPEKLSHIKSLQIHFHLCLSFMFSHWMSPLYFNFGFCFF